MAIDKRKMFIDKRRSYTADPDASWEAGQIAVETTDANGDVIVTLATGASGENPIGMFLGDKTVQSTKLEIETIVFVDGTGAPDDTQQLRGTSVDTAQVRVTSVDGLTVYTVTTHYTISASGLLTRVSGIPSGGTVIVTYRRNVLASELYTRFGTNYDRAPDDTLGNGLATVLQGNTQLRIDRYDDTKTYAPSDRLYVTAGGDLTNVAGAGRIFGYVRVPPGDIDGFLEVEFNTP